MVSCPYTTPSRRNSTLVTPTLSVALAVCVDRAAHRCAVRRRCHRHRRSRRVGAREGGDHHGGLGRGVACCVERVDRERVVGAAGEAADDAGGACGRVDELAGVVDAVACDADVVGGGRPGEGDAGGGAARRGDVRRRARRLTVRTRRGRDRHGCGRRRVAGRVIGVDADLVRISARKACEGRVGLRCRRGERRAAIDVVAGDPDVVRRGRPGDPDVRRRRRRDLQIAGLRRSDRVAGRRRRWWCWRRSR